MSRKSSIGGNVSQAMVWCLRITVALQCIGLASWTRATETPVFETLCYSWEWPEETVLLIEQSSAYGLSAGAALLLVCPIIVSGKRRLYVDTPVLIAVAAWQICVATATWHQAEGLPEGYYAWLIFAEQAVRFGAPLALFLLAAGTSSATVHLAISVLRTTAAATFLAHGYEAMIGHPPFVDLIIGAGRRVTLRISQDSAEQLLVAVGAIDFVLSALVLFTRSRAAVLYMAVWGLVTASSRIVHSGLGAYFETLVRAGNAGVPLALFFVWQSMRRQRSIDRASDVQNGATIK